MNIASLVIYYIERRIILFLSVNELIPFSTLFNWYRNIITMYLVDSTLSAGNMIQLVFKPQITFIYFHFHSKLLEYQNLLCTISFRSIYTALDLSLLKTSKRLFTNILIFIKQKFCRYLDNFLAKNKLIFLDMIRKYYLILYKIRQTN